MNAIVLSIGDELVLGQTVDTNSAWLSRQLSAVGCRVLIHQTVGDDQPAIESAIRDAAGRCDFLVITGGIGPTADDLTRQALATVMGAPLVVDQRWLAQLHEFFQKRGRAMPRLNEVQAMIPRGADLIWNHNGTASGIHAILRGDSGRPCLVFVMPGVPKEMKAMFESDALPTIREESGGAVILSRTLHTFGLGESAVAEMLGNLMDRTRNPSVGTTVSAGIVSLRINARFPSLDEARREVEQTEVACRKALGELIFAAEDETLADVISRLLKSAGQTVATAESCTGGLLAKMLTDLSGSSQYFTHGWVTYANQAKEQLLGVPRDLLEQHGAVSEPVVLAMSRGALERSGADFALAISGIAGPTGGTPTKPVGTLCISLAWRDGTLVRTFLLSGDREMVRDRACKMALTMLRYHLLSLCLPF